MKIKHRNFMRGSALIEKFLIIDVTQNLSTKRMKALITRAGPGCAARAQPTRCGYGAEIQAGQPRPGVQS